MRGLDKRADQVSNKVVKRLTAEPRFSMEKVEGNRVDPEGDAEANALELQNTVDENLSPEASRTADFEAAERIDAKLKEAGVDDAATLESQTAEATEAVVRLSNALGRDPAPLVEQANNTVKWARERTKVVDAMAACQLRKGA